MTLLLILLSTPIEFGIGFFLAWTWFRTRVNTERLYCPMCEHAWREHGGDSDYEGKPVGWCTGMYLDSTSGKRTRCGCSSVRRSILYGAAALTTAAHLRSMADALPIDDQQYLAVALRRAAQDLDGRP